MIAKRRLQSAISSLFYLMQLAAQTSAATQFASHVTVNTPARSYSHGVGNPVSVGRHYGRPTAFRSSPSPIHIRGPGYPRTKPAVPFTTEDRLRDTLRGDSPWQHNSYIDVAIPLLPPSPYKVDSPDPESLWPDGLFLPPINPPRFIGNRRSGNDASDPSDPYLLEGSEAVAAVERARGHGLYYFHDIPHIASLLENQNLRIKNNLKPHRIGSIRHTWPYNRP